MLEVKEMLVVSPGYTDIVTGPLAVWMAIVNKQTRENTYIRYSSEIGGIFILATSDGPT